MKVKLTRSIGRELAKQLQFDGDPSELLEGKVVDLPEDTADRLCEAKLAERSLAKITAPAKTPEITGK